MSFIKDESNRSAICCPNCKAVAVKDLMGGMWYTCRCGHRSYGFRFGRISLDFEGEESMMPEELASAIENCQRMAYKYSS